MLPHGTRGAYAAGCHCTPCRAANAAYVAAHRAPAGLVDAGPARAHLAALAALGLGYRQSAQLAGVAPSTTRAVLAGTLPTIRPTTAARLLTVRPVLAPGALVAGTKTWRYVDSLKREGFTLRELGYRLGAQSQQLQYAARRVRVASALKVARLYASLAE